MTYASKELNEHSSRFPFNTQSQKEPIKFMFFQWNDFIIILISWQQLSQRHPSYQLPSFFLSVGSDVEKRQQQTTHKNKLVSFWRFLQ